MLHLNSLYSAINYHSCIGPTLSVACLVVSDLVSHLHFKYMLFCCLRIMALESNCGFDWVPGWLAYCYEVCLTGNYLGFAFSFAVVWWQMTS